MRDNYQPNADAVDHITLECGAHGYSPAQTAACIGISLPTLKHWVVTHPRFAEVFERAQTLAQAWWETQAQKGTAQAKIGQSVWQKSMAARFPEAYAERQEIGEIGDSAQVDKIEWVVVKPKAKEEKSE